MQERWRPIPGHEGRYEASDQGNIRSLIPWRDLPIPHLLQPETHRSGYLIVPLSTNGLRKRRRVHQLVLEAWVGFAPPGATLVRHLDGDKTNNVLENLRYGTASENQRDSVQHGSHSQTSKTHCPRGHEFTPENTKMLVHADGHSYRRCRTCRRRAA